MDDLDDYRDLAGRVRAQRDDLPFPFFAADVVDVRAMLAEIARLRAIETAARAMTTHYDHCEECQEEGSCAEAYDLWMAVKDALNASEEGERDVSR